MNKPKGKNKSALLIYFRKNKDTGKTEKEMIEKKLGREVNGRDLIEPYMKSKGLEPVE